MKTKYALWILLAAFLFFVAAAVWGNPTLVSIATAFFCCCIGLCVGQLLKNKKGIDIPKKTKLKMLGFGIVVLMADILIAILFQKHTTAIITVVALTLICSAIMYAIAIKHCKTE